MKAIFKPTVVAEVGEQAVGDGVRSGLRDEGGRTSRLIANDSARGSSRRWERLPSPDCERRELYLLRTCCSADYCQSERQGCPFDGRWQQTQRDRANLRNHGNSALA